MGDRKAERGRRKRKEGREGRGRREEEEGRGKNNLVTFFQLGRPCLLSGTMKPTRHYNNCNRSIRSAKNECLIFRSPQ